MAFHTKLSKIMLATAALATHQITFAQNAAPVAEAAAGNQQFSVKEYRVLGNTVLPPADIEAALYGMLGDNKTIADVEVARQALEKLYRSHGYGTVYVDIPEQSVDSGVVRLKVTEGRLDRVHITGARYFANAQIREQLPALNNGKVVSLPDLQAQLGAVNQQSRDRQISPILKAGRLPGTVDVELKVQDTLPFHASAELNDRYSANTSKTRLSLNASYDNLWQRFQQLSIQYQTTPEKPSETRVLAATYIAPLEKSGNIVALYAVDTNSDFAAVGADGAFAVLGAGRIYGARYIVRLPTENSYSSSVTLGADYKNFSDKINLSDGVSDTTPIKYAMWSAGYSGNRYATSATTAVNVTLNAGVRGVPNSSEDFENKRYKAKANFFYLRADANHENRMWWDSSIYMRIAGQWTGDPLISNEQFAIGGAESVRGYLESAQLGDIGVSGTIELRTPSFHKLLGTHVDRLFGFGFYDAGRINVLEPLPGQVSHDDLAGWGAGIRLLGFAGINAALDCAWPLRATGTTEKGVARLHFQLRYGF